MWPLAGRHRTDRLPLPLVAEMQERDEHECKGKQVV